MVVQSAQRQVRAGDATPKRARSNGSRTIQGRAGNLASRVRTRRRVRGPARTLAPARDYLTENAPHKARRSRRHQLSTAVPAQNAGATTSCVVDPAACCGGEDTRAAAPCVSAAISTCGPGPVAPRASAPNQTGKAKFPRTRWAGNVREQLYTKTKKVSAGAQHQDAASKQASTIQLYFFLQNITGSCSAFLQHAFTVG